MALRVCSYNIEWFNHLFNKDNTLRLEGDELKRLTAIKKVLKHLDPDVLGIVEGPNTTVDGSQSTIVKLEAFAQWAGLRINKALTGFISGGVQELAIMFDPARVDVTHTPGGDEERVTNPPFNGELRIDTDDDRIKEVYKHYRPPLEATVAINGTDKRFKLMVVHTKSKGIFSSMDMVHWERESQRNQLKLFAECTWIRKRIDEWLENGEELIVMGDINDGPGMDYYEAKFGRSAVEVIMGDIFCPDRILRSYIGKPKWGYYGWTPASARFTDRFTETNVNVLIDHILCSRGIAVTGEEPQKIWNPYDREEAEPIKWDLREASDHFPITVDLDY